MVDMIPAKPQHALSLGACQPADFSNQLKAALC